MKLYSYWRSSASYRLRIALNIKGVHAEQVAINLAPTVREHLDPKYLSRNPEGRVPAIETDDGLLGQSMAIIEWLEETVEEPRILPPDPWERARCRAFANTIASDIHPLNNSSVLAMLRDQFHADPDAVTTWYQHWVARGFDVLELDAAARRHSEFLFGDAPSLAEICLVPQIANARRFHLDMSPYPALLDIERKCLDLKSFIDAQPENQPDAPKEM